MNEKQKWQSGKTFVVDQNEHKTFLNRKRGFKCSLCGHDFKPNDQARWIYCNSTPGQHTGNFFVCQACDGPTEEVMKKAKNDLSQVLNGMKRWGIE